MLRFELQAGPIYPKWANIARRYRFSFKPRLYAAVLRRVQTVMAPRYERECYPGKLVPWSVVFQSMSRQIIVYCSRLFPLIRCFFSERCSIVTLDLFPSNGIPTPLGFPLRVFFTRRWRPLLAGSRVSILYLACRKPFPRPSSCVRPQPASPFRSSPTCSEVSR